MKGLVLEKVNQLKIRNDIPKPSPKKRDVVIKVKYCGICGSDLEAYQYGKIFMPLILGHEFSGIITGLGSNVEGWRIGDRVTAYPGEFCGKCYFCKNHRENLCKRMGAGLGIIIMLKAVVSGRFFLIFCSIWRPTLNNLR